MVFFEWMLWTPDLAQIESCQYHHGVNVKTREQVIDLVLKGHTSQEIADLCHVTKSAVRHHLGILFKKYGVKSTPRLILAVMEENRKKAESLNELTHDVQDNSKTVLNTKVKRHAD